MSGDVYRAFCVLCFSMSMYYGGRNVGFIVFSLVDGCLGRRIIDIKGPA